MSSIFDGRVFGGFHDHNWGLPWSLPKPGRIFEDLEFRRCTFVGCTLSVTKKPKLRSTVRNVRLLDCCVRGCTLGAAIIEDVVVDGLTPRKLGQAWGTALKHVTLRGKIGGFMISPLVTSRLDSVVQRAFDAANAAYYEEIDWALDIREAEFMDEVDLRGVPGRLVRRDPDTQVMITRERAQQGHWRQLDLARTYWPTALETFLQCTTLDSTVFVVPQRVPRHEGLWTRRTLLDGLQRLRDAGIAEPD